MLRLNWFDVNVGVWQHDYLDGPAQAEERVAAIKTNKDNIPTYSVQGCWNDSQRKYEEVK